MKKTASLLTILALLTTIMPVLSVLSVLPVSAAPAELDVKWNLGYVGSMGNALGYENALGSLGNPSTTYRHTDVVCIEKSGTTVWFTEKGSGSSGFCARTGYSISSWKEVDGVYVIDPEGANYPGTDGVSAGIAERNGNTMTYTYTTSKDKEYLRFCFCITNDLDASGNVIYPKVYYEYTGFPGTYAEQCALDSSPVYFMPDKTVTGVRWFDGYVGSQFNDMYYVNEIRPYYSTYSYTSIITVPKAGTTISFTDSAAPFADTAVWVISSWRAAGETWVLDTGGANFTAQDPAVLTDSNGQNTYSYTTGRDNEHLRLCLHTDGTGNLPAVIWDAPEGTYNADVTANTGTASEITELPTIAVTEPSRNSQASGSGNAGGSSAGIYVLCFTGIAYFAGYMIFKRPEKKLKEQEKCRDDKK